jgi:hypothetical protein
VSSSIHEDLHPEPNHSCAGGHHCSHPHSTARPRAGQESWQQRNGLVYPHPPANVVCVSRTSIRHSFGSASNESLGPLPPTTCHCPRAIGALYSQHFIGLIMSPKGHCCLYLCAVRLPSSTLPALLTRADLKFQCAHTSS